MNFQRAVLLLSWEVLLLDLLVYTFSDSFWFSAVEGEVYAMSSFLMAVPFWLGLKWENDINTPRGNRWLVLISFVVGLSFGVHILFSAGNPCHRAAVLFQDLSYSEHKNHTNCHCNCSPCASSCI